MDEAYQCNTYHFLFNLTKKIKKQCILALKTNLKIHKLKTTIRSTDTHNNKQKTKPKEQRFP